MDKYLLPIKNEKKQDFQVLESWWQNCNSTTALDPVTNFTPEDLFV